MRKFSKVLVLTYILSLLNLSMSYAMDLSSLGEKSRSLVGKESISMNLPGGYGNIKINYDGGGKRYRGYDNLNLFGFNLNNKYVVENRKNGRSYEVFLNKDISSRSDPSKFHSIANKIKKVLVGSGGLYILFKTPTLGIIAGAMAIAYGLAKLLGIGTVHIPHYQTLVYKIEIDKNKNTYLINSLYQIGDYKTGVYFQVLPEKNNLKENSELAVPVVMYKTDRKKSCAKKVCGICVKHRVDDYYNMATIDLKYK